MINSGKAERLATRNIRGMRERGEPIAMLTAYDFTMAAPLDGAGVDRILVGDSMGNVAVAAFLIDNVTLS